MYRLLLILFLALRIKASNVDYSNEIYNIQNEVGKLTTAVNKLGVEIKKYFPDGEEPVDWYRKNKDKLKDEAMLLKTLQDNVTSTRTNILRNTEVFQKTTAATELSLKSETLRAGKIQDRLTILAHGVDDSSARLSGVREQLRQARAQQRSADELLNEAQVRLRGLRVKLDELLNREGQIDSRLKKLHDFVHSQQERAETIFSGKQQAMADVENAKRKTKEIQDAINQARNELLALKTTGLGKPSQISKVPSMNYIKSVKTGYGKGKRIKLVLLSD